jgi:HPt (histidine-containing phosphotransfer) domain-containing protein
MSLEDLLPFFLETRRSELDALLEAVASNDLATVRQIAHQMKDVGGPYGFAAISLIAADIDQAAQRPDKRKLVELVQEYASYLSRIRFSA